MTIHEDIDEMRCIVANTTFNICHGRLQETGEVECLEVASIEDEITYRESVGNTGPSMSIPWPSTSILGMSMTVPDLFTSDPGLSTSCDDIDPPQTYMNITNSTSS